MVDKEKEVPLNILFDNPKIVSSVSELLEVLNKWQEMSKGHLPEKYKKEIKLTTLMGFSIGIVENCYFWLKCSSCEHRTKQYNYRKKSEDSIICSCEKEVVGRSVLFIVAV